MEVIIKKIEKKYLEQVSNLLNENFNHKLDYIVNNEQKYSLIALYNDEVVGHLFVTKIYNDIKKIYWAKVDYVCVKNQYRGQKIATRLLNKLEEIEEDISYYELTCSQEKLATNLYMKAGYESVDTILLRKTIKNKKNL
ncbi:MAG: GNAT family N-acetyltransferase [Bacilli bacterium]|nr:GNAT family N-acetyltransferase [Bacilli bacterium]